jgi:hypothetical protein
MAISKFCRAAVLLALTLVVTPATGRGDFITNLPGDFLSSYKGPQNGDLNVIGAEVRYDGTNFLLHLILNGQVGFTKHADYVFGFNRGQGTAPFKFFQGVPFEPGVLFDGIIDVKNIDSVTNGVTVTTSGNEIFAIVPASLPSMASTGFAPENYMWNVWPRNPDFANGPAGFTEFVPHNSDARVTPVPAPPAFILGAVGAMGLLGRRALSRKVKN